MPEAVRPTSRQSAGRLTGARGPCVETLEGRQLMASVGPVVAQQFVGTPEAISAVVLTFNVPLDPTSAQNVASYGLVRKYRDGNDGYFEDGKSTTSSDRITVTSAVYDSGANTVTLTTRREFELKRNFTVIVVKGKGPNAVLNADGTALDGDGNGKPGGDVTLRFKASGRNRMSFREADGDRVTLRVEGAGKLLYFLPIKGRSSPSIFIREAAPESTSVNAVVKAGKHGDGVIDIAQLSGIDSANVTFLTDPAFRIRITTP